MSYITTKFSEKLIYVTKIILRQEALPQRLVHIIIWIKRVRR